MKRKTAPTSYTAATHPAQGSVPARVASHPSQGLASSLVRWMDRGDTPPSLVLAQGLMLARSPLHDGLPIEQTRHGWRAAEGDNRVVMGLLDLLKGPGVDKAAVIAPALRAVWVDKRSAPRVAPARPRPLSTPAASTSRTRVTPTAPVVIVRRAARVLERP